MPNASHVRLSHPAPPARRLPIRVITDVHWPPPRGPSRISVVCCPRPIECFTRADLCTALPMPANYIFVFHTEALTSTMEAALRRPGHAAPPRGGIVPSRAAVLWHLPYQRIVLGRKEVTSPSKLAYLPPSYSRDSILLLLPQVDLDPACPIKIALFHLAHLSAGANRIFCLGILKALQNARGVTSSKWLRRVFARGMPASEYRLPLRLQL